MTKLRTLLVDDVEGLRHLFRLTLEESGEFVVVGEAATGLEAIEQAGALQPDLVLLDLSMPEMDGLEALPEVLRASPESMVVILSGFTRDRLGETTRRLGAMGYLEKGLGAATLVKRLTQMVVDEGAPALD